MSRRADDTWCVRASCLQALKRMWVKLPEACRSAQCAPTRASSSHPDRSRQSTRVHGADDDPRHSGLAAICGFHEPFLAGSQTHARRAAGWCVKMSHGWRTSAVRPRAQAPGDSASVCTTVKPGVHQETGGVSGMARRAGRALCCAAIEHPRRARQGGQACLLPRSADAAAGDGAPRLRLKTDHPRCPWCRSRMMTRTLC
jgi:hypothetical protein